MSARTQRRPGLLRPDPTTLDDAELVRGYVVERTEEAFRELYRRHTPRLYQLALRLNGWAEDEAREVVQETWIRATAKLGEFGWRSSLATWLTSIAVNVGRELERRRRRWPEPLKEGATEPWAGVDSPDDGARIDLERVLALLPDGYRRVLVLHDVEGFTHPEISRLLDIEVGTSKSQLARARKRLREALTTRDMTARRT